MEIYAEYLFLENFITGILLLVLTGKICGKKIKKKRLLCGGVLCGMYSFVLLWDNMGILLSMLSKIGFSLVLVIVVFPPGGIGKYTCELGSETFKGLFSETAKILRTTLIFYLVSFAMGGITIGLMYFAGIKGMTQNATLYLGMVSYMNIALGVAVSYLLLAIFASFLKQRVRQERDYSEVIVEISGQRWQFRALIDTGNFLREPLTGSPVAVICQEAAGSIIPICGQERFCVIPYKTVGMESGIMDGFRVDRVMIGETTINKMVLGIYKGRFSSGGEENYEILLHKDITEGGIGGNVSF